MTIEDILLDNFEYNKTAEESNKRPEKILRFFRLSSVKTDFDHTEEETIIEENTGEESTGEESIIEENPINDNIVTIKEVYDDNENLYIQYIIVNSDLISKYNNRYFIPVKNIDDIINSINITNGKIYNSINDLKDKETYLKEQLNEILTQLFINVNEFNNPNSELNEKIKAYKKDINEDGSKDNLYIISEDIANELLELSDYEINKKIIRVPKKNIIYSEMDKNYIINKFNEQF